MAKSSNRLTKIGANVQAVKNTRMKQSDYDAIQRDASQATYAMHLRQLKRNSQLTIYAG